MNCSSVRNSPMPAAPVSSRCGRSTGSPALIINMTGTPSDHVFGGMENVEEWLVEDPYGEDPETYQRVFEGIRRRVNQLALALREKRVNQKAGR